MNENIGSASHVSSKIGRIPKPIKRIHEKRRNTSKRETKKMDVINF